MLCLSTILHLNWDMSTRNIFLLFIIISLGVALRVILFSQGAATALENSYEIVTPVTSFKRLLEGVWFESNGQSPYFGSSYHGVPLLIPFFKYLTSIGTFTHHFIFIAFDVLACVLLYLLPWSYQLHHSYEWDINYLYDFMAQKNKSKKPMIPRNQISDLSTHHADSKLLFIPPSSNLSLLMALCFMLNPFTVMSCVAKSTQVIQNVFIILVLFSSLCGALISSSLFLSICIYFSPYYIVLVPPCYMIVQSRWRGQKSITSSILFPLLTFTFTLILLVSSYIILGGSLEQILDFNYETNKAWRFVKNVYTFHLFVDDLQPNIGLFWYFMTEIFQYFRLLFLFVFQYHIFIYTIPVSIKFKGNPVLAFWVLLTVVCCFKPYPSISDASLSLAILPIISHLIRLTEYTSLVVTGAVTCSVLLPLMWRMWIWNGTGNANFYYAVGLGVVFCYAVLISDVMNSALKRQFLIKQLFFKQEQEPQDQQIKQSNGPKQDQPSNHPIAESQK